MRCLVVEDNDILRNLIVKFVGECGFDVMDSGTLKGAMKLIYSNEFDLILLDIELSSDNGLEILKTSQVKRSKVIIVSGYASSENQIRSFKLGAYVFHPKPIDFELLKAQVERFFVDPNKPQLIQGSLCFDGNQIEIPINFHEAVNELLRSNIVEHDRLKDLLEVSTDNALSLKISRLRRLLSKQYRIKSVYGRGYRLTLEVE